jgi:hypothetical protein
MASTQHTTYYLAADPAGAATPLLFTRLSMPFLDQEQCLDPGCKVAELRRAIGEDVGAADMVAQYGRYPFGYAANSGAITAAVFPLVVQYRGAELTKLPIVEAQSETVNIAVSSGSGTHYILADMVKSWTPAMFEQVARRCVDSGLAAKVVGTNNVGWVTKLAKKQSAQEITPRKLRFLPQRLVGKAA